MVPNFVIRDLEPGDKSAVVDIIALTMTDDDIDWAKSTLDNYFQNGQPPPPSRIPKYYVAVAEGEVVGISGFYIHQGHYWLAWFAVRPEYQQKGIGSALLREAEAAVRERGARELYVLTSSLPPFARAREFYRRKGFVRKHRADKRRYGDDAIVISKVFEARSG